MKNMPAKIYDQKFNGRYVPKRVNENVWFERYQATVLELANTKQGRDLLCIDQTYPEITKIAKNYVQCEYSPGRFMTDFRTGAKWGNVIRYKWYDVLNAVREMNEMRYHFMDLSGFNSFVLPAGVRGTTTTVYPEPDAASTAGDGFINHSDTTWNAVHDATSGTDAQNASDPNRVEIRDTGAGSFVIKRLFANFDTSAIGTDTVDDATFSMYCDLAHINSDNDGDDFISIVDCTPASNTTLVVGDFDQCGDSIDDPTEMHDVGERKDLTSISTAGAYTDWTLNAAGEAAINGSGVTNLGAREGHDILDNAPASSGNNLYRPASADGTGTTQDPKLVVNHTASATFAPRAIMF